MWVITLTHIVTSVALTGSSERSVVFSRPLFHSVLIIEPGRPRFVSNPVLTYLFPKCLISKTPFTQRTTNTLNCTPSITGQFLTTYLLHSSVSIAIRYGLDGPGMKSQWGQNFLHPSRPTVGPTQPPIQWVPGLSQG